MAQQLASTFASTKTYPQTIKRTMRYYQELHRNLWDWLSDNPNCCKEDWPYWNFYPRIHDHFSTCFACYFAYLLVEHYKSNVSRCHSCPITWSPDHNPLFLCCDPRSPFEKWSNTDDPDECTRLARQIANMKWSIKKNPNISVLE